MQYAKHASAPLTYINVRHLAARILHGVSERAVAGPAAMSVNICGEG